MIKKVINVIAWSAVVFIFFSFCVLLVVSGSRMSASRIKCENAGGYYVTPDDVCLDRKAVIDTRETK
jgi:hypothetical protein